MNYLRSTMTSLIKVIRYENLSKILKKNMVFKSDRESTSDKEMTDLLELVNIIAQWVHREDACQNKQNNV